MLPHLVTAGTLNSMLVLIFDKLSHFDASTDAIDHRISGNPKFLEPTMLIELDCAAGIAGIERPPNFSDCSRFMSLPLRTPLDLERNSPAMKEESSTFASRRTERKVEEAGGWIMIGDAARISVGLISRRTTTTTDIRGV